MKQNLLKLTVLIICFSQQAQTTGTGEVPTTQQAQQAPVEQQTPSLITRPEDLPSLYAEMRAIMATINTARFFRGQPPLTPEESSRIANDTFAGLVQRNEAVRQQNSSLS